MCEDALKALLWGFPIEELGVPERLAVRGLPHAPIPVRQTAVSCSQAELWRLGQNILDTIYKL